ncbi:MAG: hypothetical protein MUF00_10975 [Gemmatimonadaceae bacterium]|jgi:hypothetical protein|nr:hypothetical protein [Gemmatimonadaceae bacterium]
MRSRLILALGPVLATLAACGDERIADPEPTLSSPRSVQAASPVAAVGGIAGFHFLPPIGDPPNNITADVSVLDLLSVEICAWNGTICEGPLVARFIASSARARLLLTNDGSYAADWRASVDPSKDYRIRVLASGGQLGFADVNVIGPSEGGPRPGIVNVEAGAVLPIRFIIAQGTGQRVGPSGGLVQLPSGPRLSVPAGALAAERFITATPATNLPPTNRPLIPGTAFDFGPDGLVFARPVTLTIPYDPANVPRGVAEDELRIHKVVGGQYVQQNAGRVDLVNKTVSAEVDGFSVYVTVPRNRTNPEDVIAPVVDSLQVFDPVTGRFGPNVTLNTGSGDARLTMRIAIKDNLVGVGFIDIRWTSPSGRQLRFPCYTNAPPNSGNDTNGEWICNSDMPQFAEAGLWRPNLLWIRDRLDNFSIYTPGAGGLCNRGVTPNQCLPSVPQITVVSTPTDVTVPQLSSLEVSPAAVPRVFGPSVAVNVTTAPAEVILGLATTDDLSGVGNFIIFDGLGATMLGPSGQEIDNLFGNCIRTTGTALSGFWECRLTVPAQAESGVWRISRLRVSDRAGNGGWPGPQDFFLNTTTGQLCRPSGQCIATPTIVVTGTGDGSGPDLQTLTIAANGPTVTTTLGLIDIPSGVQRALVIYRSVTTTQNRSCFAARTAGTINNGTFACPITFDSLSARGQWVISLELFDVAGNRRIYNRRAADGFLCYQDPGMPSPICRDFGTSDLILR